MLSLGKAAVNIDVEDYMERDMAKGYGLAPVHPGEIIREDILSSAGLSVSAAGKALASKAFSRQDAKAQKRSSSSHAKSLP